MIVQPKPVQDSSEPNFAENGKYIDFSFFDFVLINYDISLLLKN